MPEPLILVVEDNERNLKLVRDLLQVKGFRTIEAENAQAGLALAAEKLPDLILMDVQLPDMDGLQALVHLRSNSRTAHLLVVALTAFAMAEDRERFRRAGFDGYIAKPIGVRTFPEQVRRFLGRSEPAATDTPRG